MNLATNPLKTYTPEEYLALEVVSDSRSEDCNGAIIPMTGGTPAHNESAATLIFLLKSALRKQPYSIFVTDQRLWIPERDLYTYPDVMVTPRPADLKPGRTDTVMAPVLIAEVFSDSSQGYDRGDKFEANRTIPTLQEYLLIDQSSPHVEQYAKQAENQWLFTEHRGLEQAFTLQSVAVTLVLTELYEAVFSQT